jgi:cytoskeletal protein RodZ
MLNPQFFVFRFSLVPLSAVFHFSFSLFVRASARPSRKRSGTSQAQHFLSQNESETSENEPRNSEKQSRTSEKEPGTSRKPSGNSQIENFSAYPDVRRSPPPDSQRAGGDFLAPSRFPAKAAGFMGRARSLIATTARLPSTSRTSTTAGEWRSTVDRRAGPVRIRSSPR